jgi:hypothetical protein
MTQTQTQTQTQTPDPDPDPDAPALTRLVAVWNLVGALGFTLCGAFGYSPLSGIKYESALSTWWGSWAFLFGSLAQCWEVVWREPQPKGDGSGQ